MENFGYAWQTGLRQGSRLVEICKHPVTALTHEQMVDLLKTSMTVIVTVIPPHPDGSPRKGCHLMTCNHAYGENSNNSNNGNSGDYENLQVSGFFVTLFFINLGQELLEAVNFEFIC